MANSINRELTVDFLNTVTDCVRELCQSEATPEFWADFHQCGIFRSNHKRCSRGTQKSADVRWLYSQATQDKTTLNEWTEFIKTRSHLAFRSSSPEIKVAVLQCFAPTARHQRVSASWSTGRRGGRLCQLCWCRPQCCWSQYAQVRNTSPLH